jgi:hypothetical protein
MQLLCPPRVRSNGLLVVALGLLLPTCGDSGGNSSLGPARNGGAGGGGGVGGATSGQGGASNPFAGASGSGQGGAAGGSLDAGGGGGGADTGGGTGPATIKFCNTLIIGDGTQVADTTIELTVGTVKLTSTTNSCSPPAPMPCTSVPAGANRVIMNVVDPPGMAMPVIYDQMLTFNAGTAYLVLSTFDEATMMPSVVSEPFPAGASCATFVPPPTPMKFCNRFFRGTTPISLDLEVAGLKFTATSGTCSPALNQACVAVPSGGQTLTLKEGATVLATAALALVPTVQSIIHASPVNNMPVLGGLELPETAMCSMVDYAAVDMFLNMNPPMPYQPMRKLAPTPGPASRLNTTSGWKIMAGPSRFAAPPLR